MNEVQDSEIIQPSKFSAILFMSAIGLFLFSLLVPVALINMTDYVNSFVYLIPASGDLLYYLLLLNRC